MADSRELLEITAEYVSYKQAAAEGEALISETEAEAHLAAIADLSLIHI